MTNTRSDQQPTEDASTSSPNQILAARVVADLVEAGLIAGDDADTLRVLMSGRGATEADWRRALEQQLDRKEQNL